jgi:hypothetical protein
VKYVPSEYSAVASEGEEVEGEEIEGEEIGGEEVKESEEFKSITLLSSTINHQCRWI